MQEIIEREDLSEMIDAVEKKILEEDYTAMDLAAAFLRMAMGDEVEDTIDDFRTARDLERLDRPAKERRGRRGDGGRRGGREDMVRLFINIGKNQGVKPGDVLGAIAGESGMPGKLVGEHRHVRPLHLCGGAGGLRRRGAGGHEERQDQGKEHSHGDRQAGGGLIPFSPAV